MSCLRNLIALLILTFSSSILFGQASADNNESFTASNYTLTEITDQDWSIYNDEENNIFYIDFETISFNLNEIVVLNDNDEIIFKEEVFDLPVNTIYELDFKEFGSGNYRIELRSFTGFIKQNVEIQ